MTLRNEYRDSLKMVEVEELLDLAFYRPLSFGFVKLIYRMPITPNQVTFLSLLTGLASASCFASGTASGFIWGGIWLVLANLLDCSDGQLARMQHSGSPFGRLADGVTDWVIGTATFIGLGAGLTATTGNALMWLLAAAGGVTSAMHATIFDYYQQEYICNVRGEENFLFREIDRATLELRSLLAQQRKSLRILGMKLYLVYLTIQRRTQFKRGPRQQFPPDLFRQANRSIMRWWTLLGSTTNRSLLVVAALFLHPGYFLWLVLVPGNIYLMVLLIWQRRLQRRLEAQIA